LTTPSFYTCQDLNSDDCIWPTAVDGNSITHCADVVVWKPTALGRENTFQLLLNDCTYDEQKSRQTNSRCSNLDYVLAGA